MPDGTIVTEKEVVAFCPGLDTLADDTPEALLLPMIEDSVKEFLRRELTTTPYVQEVDIKDEIIWSDILIKSRDTFLTQDFPVITWTKLEKIVSRDKITGLPDQLLLIPRDTYHVKLVSGIVRLLRPLQDIELRPQFSFPIGVASMQATYTAGFANLAAIPAPVKLGVLMRFKRFLAMMKGGDWNLKMVVNPQGGQTTYFRIDWTPEEMSVLQPFVRDALIF